MIWTAIIVTVYIISMLVCRLVAILVGSDKNKVGRLVAFTPFVNVVGMVFYLLVLKDVAKSVNNKHKDNKPETAKN